MNLLLPTTLTLLISFSATLQAADARFCDSYARTAVKQQIANVSQSCAEKGKRWSASYTGQKAWCMKANKNIASKETEARNNALDSCGADTRKINWRTLPDIPRVWNRLAAQMLEATKKDDVVAVRLMHSNGVSILHDNHAMLYHAVDHQAEKTAAYLLSQRANPKTAINGGGNALSKMIEDRKINYRMLGALLRGGFDPNYGGRGRADSSFPLLLAASKNDYTAVEMMLRAGGNPNLKRNSTPLLYAVKNRNMSMVKLLIQRGANPNLHGNSSRCLPLDMAQKSGSRGVIDFLTSKGAKTSQACR